MTPRGADAPRVLRTFVAFPVPDDVRARLAQEGRRLCAAVAGLRPIPAENLHLTVHFLGATREDDVPKVTAVLDRTAEGRGPLPVRYVGLGAFPSPARPRVVWAGLVETGEAGALAGLARGIREALRPLGYPGEDRAFHGHVTLARVGAARVRRLEEALGVGGGRRGPDVDFGPGVLSDLRLMVSEPGPEGSTYRPLWTRRLA